MIRHATITRISNVSFAVEADTEDEVIEKIKAFISDKDSEIQVKEIMHNNTEEHIRVSSATFKDLYDLDKTNIDSNIGRGLYPYDFAIGDFEISTDSGGTAAIATN